MTTPVPPNDGDPWVTILEHAKPEGLTCSGSGGRMPQPL